MVLGLKHQHFDKIRKSKKKLISVKKDIIFVYCPHAYLIAKKPSNGIYRKIGSMSTKPALFKISTFPL